MLIRHDIDVLDFSKNEIKINVSYNERSNSNVATITAFKKHKHRFMRFQRSVKLHRRCEMNSIAVSLSDGIITLLYKTKEKFVN